jgi:hypothetical protein
MWRLLPAALLLLPVAAEARMKAGPVVMSPHVREWVGAGGGGGTAPPGMPNPTVAYSFRKLVATANPLQAARIRRASDNAEQDIGFAGNDFDTATATSFCASTSCFVKTMYDQTLTLRHMTQGTAASQPELFFGCTPTSLPCLRTTLGSTQTLVTASFAVANAVMSMSGVSRRAAGTGPCYLITALDTNRVSHSNGTAGYGLFGNSLQIVAAPSAAENTWHSATGMINGASSSLVADTTTTTGSGAANTGTSTASMAKGAGSTTCHEVEAMWWDATALTAQQAADLNANQKLYWGF